MLAIVQVDGGMYRIVSLAYMGSDTYLRSGWYHADSNSFVLDNAKATLYRSAESASLRLADLNGGRRVARDVPYIPEVTQHIDGYGITAPRVWTRELPI